MPKMEFFLMDGTGRNSNEEQPKVQQEASPASPDVSQKSSEQESDWKSIQDELSILLMERGHSIQDVEDYYQKATKKFVGIEPTREDLENIGKDFIRLYERNDASKEGAQTNEGGVDERDSRIESTQYDSEEIVDKARGNIQRLMNMPDLSELDGYQKEIYDRYKDDVIYGEAVIPYLNLSEQEKDELFERFQSDSSELTSEEYDIAELIYEERQYKEADAYRTQKKKQKEAEEAAWEAREAEVVDFDTMSTLDKYQLILKHEFRERMTGSEWDALEKIWEEREKFNEKAMLEGTRFLDQYDLHLDQLSIDEQNTLAEMLNQHRNGLEPNQAELLKQIEDRQDLEEFQDLIGANSLSNRIKGFFSRNQEPIQISIDAIPQDMRYKLIDKFFSGAPVTRLEDRLVQEMAQMDEFEDYISTGSNKVEQ